MNAAIEKLQEAITLISDTKISNNMSIGIGITTRNRYDVFKKSFSEICRLSKGCKIVVVDDASSTQVPEATFRFNQNVGIAQAKNKCFELLDDCDHIFLIDDDTYPLKENWYLPYIESGHAHLMYIFQDFATGRKLNDSALLYQDSKIKAWSHARGCMLYFKRECLEKVGGMNPIFGKWGWEHVNLSERIYYAGLTQFKYADIANNAGLLYSADEHETVQSTVIGSERSEQINKNRPVYETLKGGCEYIPYKQKKNILLTSYFANVPDPQRNAKWSPAIQDIEPLYKSTDGKCDLVILHDCLGQCEDNGIEYVHCETSVNPYFQRWISYRQYLIDHRSEIESVFCIDATDIELLKSPFTEMQSHVLYAGDEVEMLGCQWMYNHHKHPELNKFFTENKHLQLLNAGILGGSLDMVVKFMNEIIEFYFDAKHESTLNPGQPDAGNTDMGVFNYIARTKFSNVLKHGAMVNTRFKANERTNLAWFKHK